MDFGAFNLAGLSDLFSKLGGSGNPLGGQGGQNPLGGLLAKFSGGNPKAGAAGTDRNYGALLSDFLTSRQGRGFTQGLLSGSRDKYGRSVPFGDMMASGLAGMNEARDREEELGLKKQKLGLDAQKALNERQPEIVRTAQYLFPNDPEAQRRFIESSKTKPLVQMGDKAIDKVTEKRLERISESEPAILEAKNDIREYRDTLNKLSEMGYTTGPWAEILAKIGPINTSEMGLTDPNAVALLEKLQAVQKRILTSQGLSGISAKGLNQFIEKKILEGLPNIGKSIQGNLEILDSIEQGLDLAQEYGDFNLEYFQENQNVLGADKAWRKRQEERRAQKSKSAPLSASIKDWKGK